VAVRRFADDGVASINVPPWHSRYERFRACFFFFDKAPNDSVTTENHPISAELFGQFAFFG
jgi:hypothetical protein